MPFTPFHLGFGAAFKAIGGRNFSFMVFGGSQVLMDIEPAVQLIRNSGVLHGYTHTLAGAFVIGCIATLIGRPISLRVLRSLPGQYTEFSWRASAVGAFSGTFSHVGLDALMHADMMPLWPFSQGNPMLRTVSLETLHLSCIVLGVVAGLAVWYQSARQRHD